jgi:chromate reductase
MTATAQMFVVDMRSRDVFQDDGEVTNDSTREFLRAYMAEFRTYIGMVLTVLPRPQEPSDATGVLSGEDDGR